jgi:endonuclease YncB( thermonuclease family)
VKDAQPLVDPKRLKFGGEVTYKVAAIVDERTLQMDNGLVIQLLGISVPPERRRQAITYLQRFVLGKRVLLRFDRPPEQNGAPVPAYLYLTNRLFVNRKMIEMGLVNADRTVWHRYRERFLQVEAERNG